MKKFISFVTAFIMIFVMMLYLPVDCTFNVIAAEGRAYNQHAPYWKDFWYGGGNLYDTGCGIFSFANAIYALNGKYVDIDKVATWVHSINAYNPGNSDDGTYQDTLYANIESRFGGEYNFNVVGYHKGNVYNDDIRNHLANGGVAVANVYNHFIALTGYDTTNGYYHVIESAEWYGRGLTADSWVSSAKLSEGNTNAFWFALISSRNPAQNTKPSKPTLSVDAGTAESKTYFKWNSCSNTTHYDLRVYTGNDNIVYAIGNCSDADAFGTHMMYTDTRHAKVLSEGSYYARIAAVNNETGEYTFSDFVEFTVKALPVTSTKPSKPTLSVDAGIAGSKTYFKWNSCSNTTHYDLRVYTGNDNIVYAIGNCSDADTFGTNMMYTDTSHAKTLGEGSYYTRVAAVNNETGEYTFSDFVEFTVKPSQKKDITVTFVTATGNTSTYPKKVVSTGNKYGELPVPEKEMGRTFLNWQTANNTIITADTIVTESKDHNLYANYDYDTWVMYFDAQGGTASFDNKTVTYTKKYGELPTATREGYTFEGWKLFYTQNKYLTPDDYVYYINYDTAYAYWTPNEYIVTFNASGGNVSSTSKSVKYNTSYGTLPIPTKSGYEFLGWFDPESGSYITEETTLNISKNHTVYAHWQKEGITGDANNDGIVSVTDAVMLQKWLLGSGDITNWKNADICKDGELDVFDMIEMRKLLIQNK